jgi:hypothetical protein
MIMTQSSRLSLTLAFTAAFSFGQNLRPQHVEIDERPVVVNRTTSRELERIVKIIASQDLRTPASGTVEASLLNSAQKCSDKILSIDLSRYPLVGVATLNVPADGDVLIAKWKNVRITSVESQVWLYDTANDTILIIEATPEAVAPLGAVGFFENIFNWTQHGYRLTSLRLSYFDRL